jgi:glycosyltransferase involved in cell wall biosynthesis
MSILDGLMRDYDAMWVGNAANAVFCAAPRIRGTKVVLNVDGIERQRAKWGLAGRLWYAVGERLAIRLPNAIVSDADVIADYYRERYDHPSDVIAYGAQVLERDPPPDLAKHGLEGIEPGRYVLYVSRLEPENQADLVIRAYRSVPGDIPLLIVGDAPYADEFKSRLAALAADDPRVWLTGGVYGEGYTDLQRGALAYIQATSVGGTHPALIEAMGAGNLVLAYRTPENEEVTAGTALLFGNEQELASHLERVVTDAESAAFNSLRGAARERVATHYSWDAVTAQYEALWRRLGAG